MYTSGEFQQKEKNQNEINNECIRRYIREKIPARAAFSSAGPLITLTEGHGCGGAPAICMPCESHHINGVRAPI